MAINPASRTVFTGETQVGGRRFGDGLFHIAANGDGITAAGSTQGTATALGNGANFITGGAVNTGVILTGSQVISGLIIVIVNDSGSAKNVYPATGHNFLDKAANTAISLADNSGLLCISSGSTAWAAFDLGALQ